MFNVILGIFFDLMFREYIKINMLLLFKIIVLYILL